MIILSPFKIKPGNFFGGLYHIWTVKRFRNKISKIVKIFTVTKHHLQLHVLRREMGFSEITWRGCKVFQAEYGWTVHLWYLRVIENKSKL